jgi:hypothetical protein
MTNWLNEIGDAMAHATGKQHFRVWSCHNRNTPPGGSNIKQKPDLILIDKKYHDCLKGEKGNSSDWCFIQAFVEMTSMEMAKCKNQMIDHINAKSYLMFLSQPHRRFAIALAFTGSGHVSLTITNHEGQVHLFGVPLKNGRKFHAQAFFKIMAFLM